MQSQHRGGGVALYGYDFPLACSLIRRMFPGNVELG